MDHLVAYAAVLVSLLVIDVLWVWLVAKPLYDRAVGAILRPTPRMGAAVVFYLAYPAAVVFLAARPALAGDSTVTALTGGLVLGLTAYGTFALTNLALLQQWTVGLAVTDTAWGGTLTAVAAWLGFLAAGA